MGEGCWAAPDQVSIGSGGYVGGGSEQCNVICKVSMMRPMMGNQRPAANVANTSSKFGHHSNSCCFSKMVRY